VFFTSAMFVAVYMASTLNSRLRGREAEVVQLGRRLQRAYGRLQTLYEGAQTVNSTLDLHQVLDRLVRATAEAMGVRACSILLLDESGARLHVAAVYGLSQAYVQKGDLILERNPLAREVLAGKTIVIGDVSEDTRLQYPAEAEAEGIRSILTARLYCKSAPLGLIRAYSAELNHFTEDDATLLVAGRHACAPCAWADVQLSTQVRSVPTIHRELPTGLPYVACACSSSPPSLKSGAIIL